MPSIFPSLVALGLAAVGALLLALVRWSPPQRTRERSVAARVLAIAVSVQALHFLEEATTGFPVELGNSFSLPSMPFVAFAAFNLLWLGIWFFSIPGIRSGRTPAFFAAWFLSIAGAFNGIAHPALAILSGQYFPGLISSPIIAAVSVLPWVRLHRATIARGVSARDPPNGPGLGFDKRGRRPNS